MGLPPRPRPLLLEPTSWGSNNLFSLKKILKNAFPWPNMFYLCAIFCIYAYMLLQNVLGKLHLPPRTFAVFANTSTMFKTSHLGVSNSDFLSLCPFCTKNANFTLDSKTTLFPKRCSFSFGVRGKIDIR
jgi:hypothetical protein